MSKKLVLLVALLSFASLSIAQDAPSTRVPANRDLSEARHDVQGAMAAAPIAPSTVTCAASYASGYGERRTTDCVTVNGNISELSVNGEEMINAGIVDEGYGLCDFNTGVSYFDYGANDSGNLLGSSFSLPNGKTAVSTRITTDGIWQITNTVMQVLATNTSPGKVIAKTVVKNMTGISRGIFFLRHADLDANGNSATNDFDWGVNTAYGTFNGGGIAGTSTTQGYGLEMLDNSYNGAGGSQHNFYTLNTFAGPTNVCSPFANVSTQPFSGDGSLMGLFSATVGPNKAATFQITYQPI